MTRITYVIISSQISRSHNNVWLGKQPTRFFFHFEIICFSWPRFYMSRTRKDKIIIMPTTPPFVTQQLQVQSNLLPLSACAPSFQRMWLRIMLLKFPMIPLYQLKTKVKLNHATLQCKHNYYLSFDKSKLASQFKGRGKFINI